MQGVSMVPGFTLLNADTEEGGGEKRRPEVGRFHVKNSVV